jgi:acyl carrier protein
METISNTDEISAKIHAVLRPHLRFLEKDAPVPPSENLGKLGLDSMAAINLLFDLEQAFGIQIPDSLLTADAFETAASLEKTIRPLVVGH